MTRVYVSGKAIAWSSVRIAAPDGPDVNGPGLGFLPIFASKEDAERVYPDAAVYAIDVPDTWASAARPRRAAPGDA